MENNAFYPCAVRTLPMEGEEGGVAASLIIPVGEPWDGGDVEGTAKLTPTPSSWSPVWKKNKVHGIQSNLLCARGGTRTLTCWRRPRLDEADLHHLENKMWSQSDDDYCRKVSKVSSQSVQL